MALRARLAIGATGVAVLLLALFPFYGRLFGRHRLRFPYLSRPISPAAYAALAAKPGWTTAQLEVARGIRLNGLVRRPKTSAASWVLFYPGNDESQLERGQTFLINLGQDSDLGLAVFAYRGYDSSDGESSLAGIRADAPVIVHKLCEAEGIAQNRVNLVGFSIGGHFAVSAARGAAKDGQRARTLTLLASVNDIVMYQSSPWDRLSAGEDYQTTPLLDGVPAPVLVIQGAADKTFGGPGEGRAIAAALGSRASYEELPGVNHVPLLSDAHALELVRKFILAHAP